MKKKAFILVVNIFFFIGCSNTFWLPSGLNLGTYEYEDSDTHYYIYINLQSFGKVEIIRSEFEESDFVKTAKYGTWEKINTDTFKINIDNLEYICVVDSPSSFEMAGLMFYYFED